MKMMQSETICVPADAAGRGESCAAGLILRRPGRRHVGLKITLRKKKGYVNAEQNFSTCQQGHSLLTSGNIRYSPFELLIRIQAHTRGFESCNAYGQVEKRED